ncbi:conjugal transfer protein TrbL family protein [Dactylosporangium sp. NPDC000244]|uniref:conjugal transfer protein TrbL family protein n=1 Tax=Dactylosporangium sp. NPDC000244 TaxID=3154365 RepID=UPI00332F9281
MDWLFDGILNAFAKAILACADALTGLITGALLISPEVTGLPQVQALTGRSVLIVDSIFVLFFIAAGVLTMTAGGDDRARYTAKDLVPRCFVGFVTAHFSQLWCGELIRLANALTTALTQDDLTGDGQTRPAALPAIKTNLVAAQNQTTGVLFCVCGVLILILLGSAAFSMITRYAVLLILTAAAPLALACHALPQTDPVARLWWRSYTGVLAVPVAQGLTLYAGQWMLTDSSAMLPALGLPVDPGGVMNLFVVMVLLWTTVKVPSLLGRFATSGGQRPNAFGAVVRVVVVQQLSRAVPGIGRAARAVIR